MNAVKQLLAQLQAHHIELWESDGALRFRAPEGAFTPALREQVRAQKTAILAALRAQQHLRHDPDQRYAPFPLTAVQSAYLLGRTRAWQDGGTGCHGYAELTISEPEPRTADDYQQAWQKMVACHDMLKVRVSPEGWQCVDPQVAVPLAITVAASAAQHDKAQQAIRQRLKHQQYDPQQPPLLTAHLVLGPQGTTLHLSVDLIMTDFVGINVMVTDFLQALRQPEQALQPPTLSFRDYVLHIRQQQESAAGEAARRRATDYWQQQVAAFPAPMRLGEPLHAGEQAVAYRRRSFQLAPAQWAQFRGLARQHGVTPTAVALAILGGIARRYGGQQHSRITLTVLDRQALTGDVMRIIGDFTSTLLLALDSATAQSVVAAAGAAQQQVFSALDHQALSGIEVLRLLPGEQRATPIVLTSTLGMPATPGDGVVNQLQQGLSQTPQVLLDIQLSESAGAMAVVWDSRDGSYPEPVLSAAFHDFCTALTALSGDPARWQQAALRPAPLAIGAPQLAHTAGGGNICAPFCQLARQAPHNIALIHGELQLTRGALLSHAGHWRDTLLAMGARPGDAVAISLPPGVAQVSAQLGALLAGCAFVPLDPEWPAARQQAILTTLAQARPGHQVHLITPQSVDLRYGTQPGNAAGAVTASLAGENDCAYIIFTSGSTGTPKGVPITHGQALTTLNAMQQMLGLHDGDRVLGVSRPSFDLAIFNLFGLLNAGGVLVIPRAGTMPDADAWWLDIIQHRVTLWNSVPAQLQLLLDSPPSRDDIARCVWRVALLSGDWIPAGQPAQLHQLRPDCRVIALGGATEAAIWSCFHEVPAGSHYDGSIPYGRPLPGQQMWVVNDDLEPAVTGQIGQIVIGGAAVSAGYLGADNAAFITLSDGITPGFITGDLGRYLANGEIEFLGRRDSQIKRHGYRIEPGEITALLREHPNVGDAAVVMAPRQQLVAVVTPGGASTACREADKQAAEAVEHQHLQWLSRLDAPRFTALMARMELAALVAMQDLRQRHVAVHADYLPLMARWDRMLQRKAPLLAPFNGDISFSLAERLWQQARDLAREMDYGDGQLDYIARCLQQLEQVAAGEVDPLALLFPEGRTDVALASYGENFINRYLNQLIVAGVDARARQAAAQQRPLRILEIGAGVGGTTGPVLDCLRGYQQHQGLRVDYCFTDVSRFFLDEAASRWPDITTRRCDINQDFAAQGFAPGQWDIVLCANVLHNARHIPRALARIHPLLAPGGDLAIIDAVRPSAPLMITMEFKEGLSDFQDQRAEDGEAFYPRECWQQALAASPFRHSIMLPGVTDGAHPAALAISNIHQSVIWASAGHSTPRPDTAQLHDTLRQRLPGYMLPDRILVLDTLPLTANGKVDHKTLQATLPAVTQGAETEEAISGEATDSIAATVPSLDASQRAVAVIWAGVLGITDPDSLHPGSDFFTAGGDSLLLAKCVGALRRGIPGAAAISWDDLLRQMVADPRLENCARLVWHPQAAECDSLAPPADSGGGLQTLLPAASATATERHGEVLCLIHDGSGGLAPYHALIAALAGLDERPEVIGISRSPGDQYLTLAPETLFDALADRYVQALGARPLRRVYLFGYCMGGLLAAAMAEKLTAAGIDVRQLIVVSAYRLPFTMEDDLLLDYSLARLLNQDPADIGLDFPEQPLGALITLARETWQQHIPQGAVAALAPQFPAIATALSQAPAECQQRLARLAACAGLDPATLSALRAVYVASLKATGAFNRPGYLGDITFLRQRGDIHFLPTLKEDMTRFWRDYCLGTLTITDIAGNHFDCLEGDGARSVAALLRGIWA